MAQFILIDKKTKEKSKPFTEQWLIDGDYDLEFENGETLPLNDYKAFKDDYVLDGFVNVRDEDCHYYYIPNSLKEEFYSVCERSYRDDDFEEFENKFGCYATGGAPVE